MIQVTDKGKYLGQGHCIATDGYMGILDIDEDRVVFSSGVPRRPWDLHIRKIYYSAASDDYWFTDGYSRYWLRHFLRTA